MFQKWNIYMAEVWGHRWLPKSLHPKTSTGACHHFYCSGLEIFFFLWNTIFIMLFIHLFCLGSLVQGVGNHVSMFSMALWFLTNFIALVHGLLLIRAAFMTICCLIYKDGNIFVCLSAIDMKMFRWIFTKFLHILPCWPGAGIRQCLHRQLWTQGVYKYYQSGHIKTVTVMTSFFKTLLAVRNVISWKSTKLQV